MSRHNNSVRSLAWCVVLLPLVGASPAAQDKPDLSGVWVLQDPPQPGVGIAPSLTVRQPLRRTNVRGEPMPPAFLELTVERHFTSGTKTERYYIGTVGGTVGGIADRRGSAPSRFSVRWDGDRLRIETGSYSGPTRDSGPFTEHDEVWSLDEQGRLLISVVDRRSGGEPATRTLTYRRQ
jgi:hypothetical protein